MEQLEIYRFWGAKGGQLQMVPGNESSQRGAEPKDFQERATKPIT